MIFYDIAGYRAPLSAEQKSKKVKNTVNQTFTVFFLFGRYVL